MPAPGAASNPNTSTAVMTSTLPEGMVNTVSDPSGPTRTLKFALWPPKGEHAPTLEIGACTLTGCVPEEAGKLLMATAPRTGSGVLVTLTLSPEGGPAARLLTGMLTAMAGRLQHKANTMIPPRLFMVALRERHGTSIRPVELRHPLFRRLTSACSARRRRADESPAARRGARPLGSRCSSAGARSGLAPSR